MERDGAPTPTLLPLLEVMKPVEVEWEGPSWSNLPLPVFRRLHSFLPPSFSSTARLVCSTWLQFMDYDIGHRLTISPFLSPESLHFLRTIKVVKAVVQGHHSEYLSPTAGPGHLYPASLKNLTIAGVPTSPFNFRLLEHFPNLHFLSLDQFCFMGLDGNGSLSEDLQLEPSPSAPPILLPKVWFLSLDFHFNGLSRYMPHLRLKLALKNISSLLNNLHLPQLSISLISLEIDRELRAISPEDSSKAHSSIWNFLYKNRRALDMLILSDVDKQLSRHHVPSRLRTLEVTLAEFNGSLDQKQNLEVETLEGLDYISLVLKHVHLVRVNLSVWCFPPEWIQRNLRNICQGSKETLSHFHFSSFDLQEVTLDLEIFTFCEKLEYIHIAGHRDAPLRLDNLLSVPWRCLRHLRVENCLIHLPPHPLQLGKFSKLEALKLQEIVTVPGQVGVTQTRARTAQLLRQLLALRRLSNFWLKFEDDLELILQSSEEVTRLLEEVGGLDPNPPPPPHHHHHPSDWRRQNSRIISFQASPSSPT